MVFVWDPKKRLSNIRKHGIDFRDANRVFDGLTITAADRRGRYVLGRKWPAPRYFHSGSN